MINLLPLTKVISAIAVLYAVFISIILFFNYDANSNIIDGIVVALKGATALNLILLPGFSTATSVTDVSGRGVGMDAVRTKIESLSGTIKIETEKGSFTRISIWLPLTLAIIQALLVKVCGETYAIPLANIG